MVTQSADKLQHYRLFPAGQVCLFAHGEGFPPREVEHGQAECLGLQTAALGCLCSHIRDKAG